MSDTVFPRVWLITGTSRGLGRALAELILEKGEIVIATARNPSTLDPIAQEYPSDRLLVLPLDVTDPPQIAAAFAKAKETFGRIDVVVNNAGRGDAAGELELVDEAESRAIMETNYWGTYRVSKEAVRFLRDVNPKGHGGRLLQISSYLGLVGLAGGSPYVASKFALEGMSESLAAELDPAWNIKVTLIEPGWIQTGIGTKTKISLPAPHPAYSNPSLPVTRLRASFGEGLEWKDARKSAELFYRVGVLPDPPLRLVIGKDAIGAARRKIADLKETVDKYEHWSEGLEADPEC